MTGQAEDKKKPAGCNVLPVSFFLGQAPFSGLHALELAVVELGVEAACRQQLVVIALLHDVAVLHHKDDVGLPDGGKAVGHDEAGAALHHAGKGFLDAHLHPDW